MKLLYGLATIGILGGIIVLIFSPKVLVVDRGGVTAAHLAQNGTSSIPTVPEAPPPVSVPIAQSGKDIAAQPQLPNPPEIIKAIYLTGWSAGSMTQLQRIIAMIKRTELNAVVIDVKDFSGYVSYTMDIPEVLADGANAEIRIAKPNTLIKLLHDNGVYAIARITVFQDPILAKAHPEWALRNKTNDKIWTDSKGLAWMDPAGQGTRDYVISIAKDALSRGFDEVNFDYVRFASDGALGNIAYPYWDQKTSRHSVIAGFFKYLREQMGSAKMSADLFGLATVNRDDLGIGQVLEDALKYFDAVSPMVYPSHYAPGFIGYQKPAAHPYEVIKYSMDHALLKRDALIAGTTSTPGIPEGQLGKLRPWIQDFNLGAVYTADMVKSEFKATYDSLLNGSSTSAYDGWMIWDPSNRYTESALAAKQ